MDDSPLAAPLVAVLEVVVSEHPDALGFQLEALLNGVMRSVVLELAGDFGVPVGKMRQTLRRACLDLDRLERRRGVWRDPAQVVQSPVVALVYLCRARAGRLQGTARWRQLDVILGKLQRAQELARSRAWIEEFIRPPLTQRQEAESANR